MHKWAEAVAKRMVTQVFVDSANGWKGAAKRSSKGKLIYEALQGELKGPLGTMVNYQVWKNSELIKAVPRDIARQMTEHVKTQSLAGLRPPEIAQDLRDLYPHINKVKANLIARTESSKTNTSMTQGRSELMGIEWYVWRTSEDARVRGSHRIMDGVLIPWQSAPSPELLDRKKPYGQGHYHAGGTFNCRCYPEPVVDFNYIKWPAKVYYGNQIVRMTRAQFEQLTTPQRQVAATASAV